MKRYSHFVRGPHESVSATLDGVIITYVLHNGSKSHRHTEEYFSEEDALHGYNQNTLNIVLNYNFRVFFDGESE